MGLFKKDAIKKAEAAQAAVTGFFGKLHQMLVDSVDDLWDHRVELDLEASVHHAELARIGERKMDALASIDANNALAARLAEFLPTRAA